MNVVESLTRRAEGLSFLQPDTKPLIINVETDGFQALVDHLCFESVGGQEMIFWRIKETRVPVLQVVDNLRAQIGELHNVLYPQHKQDDQHRSDYVCEYLNNKQPSDIGRWVFYPWSGELVHLLNSEDHFHLVTARSEGVLTQEQTQSLGRAKILVAGGSTGFEVLQTLTHEGVGVLQDGLLIIADFDDLGITNLGRLSAGIGDFGINKAVFAARQAWEVFPDANIVIVPEALTSDNMPDLLSQVNYAVDAMDQGMAKLWLRVLARELGVDVFMGTNLYGECAALIDVERFSRDPSLPLFHGRLLPVLGEITRESLTVIMNDQAQKQQILNLVVVLGVGLENLSPDLLNAFLAYSQGNLDGLPQMAGNVGLTAGVLVKAIKEVILGREVNPRAMINVARNLSPDYLQQRLDYLNYALQIAQNLQLPLQAVQALQQALQTEFNIPIEAQN